MEELHRDGRYAIVHHEHPGYSENYDYQTDTRIGFAAAVTALATAWANSAIWFLAFAGVILAIAGASLTLVVFGRIARGPATLGSMVAFFIGVHSFAKPGGNTTRYMAAFFLVNGVARLVAPSAAAFAGAFLSRRSILPCGGLGIIPSSVMFWWNDRREIGEERAP
jgi:hypothetical protein